MGTAGCIAEMDVRGNLTMWAKTQIPFLAQRDFMRALEAMGLDGRNARVIVPALGGGVRHRPRHARLRVHRDPARAPHGTPREDRSTRARRSSRTSRRGRARRTRIVQGCDAGRTPHVPAHRRAAGQRRLHVVGRDLPDGDAHPGHVALQGRQRLLRREARLHQQHLRAGDARLRQPRGRRWPIECTLDELAEQAGIDPFEMRLLNRNEPGETTPMGLEVDDLRPARVPRVRDSKTLALGREARQAARQAPRRRHRVARPRRRLGAHLPLRRRRRDPQARRLRQRERLVRRRRDGAGPPLGARAQRGRGARRRARQGHHQPDRHGDLPVGRRHAREPRRVHRLQRRHPRVREGPARSSSPSPPSSIPPRSRRTSHRCARRTRPSGRRLRPRGRSAPRTSSSRTACSSPRATPDAPWLRIELGRLLRALHFRGARAR